MYFQIKSLLQTKLHQPHLPQDLVMRMRLVEFLSQAINCQITLACATAGFGKTILISTWLDYMSSGHDKDVYFLPLACLALDENDNDFNIFFCYLIAALRSIFTEACTETLALQKAQKQSPRALLFTPSSNRYALFASDLDLAAKKTKVGLCDVLNRSNQQTLDRLLSFLPEEMIQSRPELLMLRVWAIQCSWQFIQQAKLVQQVEEFLNIIGNISIEATDQQILVRIIIGQKGQLAYSTNQHSRTIELLIQALVFLPRSETYVRSGAMLHLEMSMGVSGEQHEAERLLLNEYESYGNQTDTYSLYPLLTLGFIYLNNCQLEQTMQIGRSLLHGETGRGLPILQSWANHILGLACFLSNELENTAQYFSQNVENRYAAQTSALRGVFAGLVLIHHIRVEIAEAWYLVETISQFDLEQRVIDDSRTRSLRTSSGYMQFEYEYRE